MQSKANTIYHYQSMVFVCVCNQLLFRQVAHRRSITLLIFIVTIQQYYKLTADDRGATLVMLRRHGGLSTMSLIYSTG